MQFHQNVLIELKKPLSWWMLFQRNREVRTVKGPCDLNSKTSNVCYNIGLILVCVRIWMSKRSKVAYAFNINDFKLFLNVSESDAVLFFRSAWALTTNLIEQTIPIGDNCFIYIHLPAASLISLRKQRYNVWGWSLYNIV